MTPDRDGVARSRDFDQLVLNARGVAFAAYGSVDQIAAALGVSVEEAARFQIRAQDDLFFMLAEARARVRGAR